MAQLMPAFCAPSHIRSAPTSTGRSRKWLPPVARPTLHWRCGVFDTSFDFRTDKQYIIVAVSGVDGAQLIAYALP